MRDGDISSHAESPGHCWYPGRAGCGARGVQGAAMSLVRVGTTRAGHCKAQGKPTGSAPPGEQASKRQMPCRGQIRAVASPMPAPGAGATASRFSHFQAFPQVGGWN